VPGLPPTPDPARTPPVQASASVSAPHTQPSEPLRSANSCIRRPLPLRSRPGRPGQHDQRNIATRSLSKERDTTSSREELGLGEFEHLAPGVRKQTTPSAEVGGEESRDTFDSSNWNSSKSHNQSHTWHSSRPSKRLSLTWPCRPHRLWSFLTACELLAAARRRQVQTGISDG